MEILQRKADSAARNGHVLNENQAAAQADFKSGQELLDETLSGLDQENLDSEIAYLLDPPICALSVDIQSSGETSAASRSKIAHSLDSVVMATLASETELWEPDEQTSKPCSEVLTDRPRKKMRVEVEYSSKTPIFEHENSTSPSSLLWLDDFDSFAEYYDGAPFNFGRDNVGERGEPTSQALRLIESQESEVANFVGRKEHGHGLTTEDECDPAKHDMPTFARVLNGAVLAPTHTEVWDTPAKEGCNNPFALDEHGEEGRFMEVRKEEASCGREEYPGELPDAVVWEILECVVESKEGKSILNLAVNNNSRRLDRFDGTLASLKSSYKQVLGRLIFDPQMRGIHRQSKEPVLPTRPGMPPTLEALVNSGQINGMSAMKMSLNPQAGKCSWNVQVLLGDRWVAWKTAACAFCASNFSRFMRETDKYAEWRLIGHKTRAGEKKKVDWSGLVGWTLCESCYTRHANTGTLENQSRPHYQTAMRAHSSPWSAQNEPASNSCRLAADAELDASCWRDGSCSSAHGDTSCELLCAFSSSLPGDVPAGLMAVDAAQQDELCTVDELPAGAHDDDDDDDDGRSLSACDVDWRLPSLHVFSVEAPPPPCTL